MPEKNETIASEWISAEKQFSELDFLAKQRAAEIVGSVATADQVKVERVDEGNSFNTLLGALQMARLGDESALKTVKTNVQTDVAERLFKAGHQTSVDLQIDPDSNELTQNGIALKSISVNSLRHSELNHIMHNRTKTELRNALFFNLLHQNEVLETHSTVVFSHTPTDETTKNKYGFFKHTDTLSIQLLQKQENGDGYELETAFVAGKSSEFTERFDLSNVETIANNHSVEIEKVDSENMLSQIMLIPNDQLPNGVASIVEEYDDINGTFYGELKPRQNYADFVKLCENRDFMKITDGIVSKLLQETATFTAPIEANKRLNELSGKLGVEYAVENANVDARIFGEDAHRLIDLARVQQELGNFGFSQIFTQEAQKVEKSSSCPFAKSKNAADESLNGEIVQDSDEDSSGEKVMTCPFCNEKTKGDPCADEIQCGNCSASTKCSASENQRRAQEYQQEKIDRIKEKIEAQKKSPESSNPKKVLVSV